MLTRKLHLSFLVLGVLLRTHRLPKEARRMTSPTGPELSLVDAGVTPGHRTGAGSPAQTCRKTQAGRRPVQMFLCVLKYHQCLSSTGT